MKNLFAFFMLIVLLLAGCQKTPENGIVVQKDLEQMLDTAQKNTAADAAKSLAEQYGIPAEYTWQAQGADGKLNITVNAPVIVPQSGSMPIYRVQAADFTQEQVSAWWNVLIGDTKMWNRPLQRTKEQIQADILELKRLMTDEKELDSQRMMTIPEAEEELKRLEEALQSAPEVLEDVPADGTLQERYLHENGLENTGKKLASYTGLIAYEKAASGQGKYFQMDNNYNLSESIVMSKDEEGRPTGIMHPMSNASIHLRDNSKNIYPSNHYTMATVPAEPDSEQEENLRKMAGFSPREAITAVQSMLDTTGSPMVIDRVYLRKNIPENSGDASEYIYLIECVRSIGCIPVALLPAGSTAGDGEAVSAYWGYERMSFEFSALGLMSMEWLSPLTISETVNEDSQLKPFAEIQEIFEKMMFVKYEAQAKNVALFNIDINRVELSLQRIAEQNSIENGLLVPVWNFYEKAERKHDEANSSAAFGESVMSINAIDGSIIDVNKGY